MPVTIDTRSPNGNAFYIMALVKMVLTKAGREDEVPGVMADMMSGDYRHLCDTATIATNGTVRFTEGEDE